MMRNLSRLASARALGTIPATTKTLVQVGKEIVLKDTPVPEPGENEVLVKTKTIGLNPIDVSAHKFFPNDGAYIGCDLAGEVVKLGRNLKVDLKLGDPVSAVVAGDAVSGRGAFSEYVNVLSDLTWKIPPGTLTFAQAVATGSPLNTAFQALHGAKELALPQRLDSTPADNTWVFIYGGSSGVGQFGIQLAKLSGYKVVTVASPRNHEFLKGLGADAIYDYRDPEMVQKVKDAAGNKISHVLDTVASKDTQFASIKVLAEDKPGRVLIVLPHSEGIQDVRKDVHVAMINLFTSYGYGYGPTGPDEQARSALAAFLLKVPGLIKAGKLKNIPVKKFYGGLDKVVSDGFDYIAQGKVSAEKIVYEL